MGLPFFAHTPLSEWTLHFQSKTIYLVPVINCLLIQFVFQYVEYGLQGQEPPNRPHGAVLPASLTSMLTAVTTAYKTITATTVSNTTTTTVAKVTTTSVISSRVSVPIQFCFNQRLPTLWSLVKIQLKNKSDELKGTEKSLTHMMKRCIYCNKQKVLLKGLSPKLIQSPRYWNLLVLKTYCLHL